MKLKEFIETDANEKPLDNLILISQIWQLGNLNIAALHDFPVIKGKKK